MFVAQNHNYKTFIGQYVTLKTTKEATASNLENVLSIASGKFYFQKRFTSYAYYNGYTLFKNLNRFLFSAFIDWAIRLWKQVQFAK